MNIPTILSKKINPPFDIMVTSLVIMISKEDFYISRETLK